MGKLVVARGDAFVFRALNEPHAVLQLAQFLFHGEHGREHGQKLLPDRALARRADELFQISHANAAGDDDLPRVGCILPRDDAQERGFSRAVAADQADAAARFDGKIRAL